jgi:SAM-dependent methyltransferase
MRVLDIGSGAGDVAFLAAELVGDGGEVVGADRSAAALAKARQRVAARSLANVVFREGDPAEMRFAAPTYDRCSDWIVQTLRLSGPAARMGKQLHATFVAAGLPAPTMRLDALIAGGANNDALRLLAELVVTLLPEMERLGVATAGEVGVETLAERMIAEAAAGDCILVSRYEIGAWSRVSPAGSRAV